MLSYLLAEELRQNTGSFKFNIFELRDLLRYIPLQKGKEKRRQIVAVSTLHGDILPLIPTAAQMASNRKNESGNHWFTRNKKQYQM